MAGNGQIAAIESDGASDSPQRVVRVNSPFPKAVIHYRRNGIGIDGRLWVRIDNRFATGMPGGFEVGIAGWFDRNMQASYRSLNGNILAAVNENPRPSRFLPWVYCSELCAQLF
ncbi:hypothetical protein [Methylomonas sp. UP202]|uniref:hypothetical protein n=1 Tax=Methylomonas sp. UP202 TaxID=3040943 RepID=UPI00247A9E5C|nr:hypothetical protein [Methylomonas sp. UP202]WGS87844.1 hypothetical protein QC632_08790 [Methylomonas sp. UP202]